MKGWLRRRRTHTSRSTQICSDLAVHDLCTRPEPSVYLSTFPEVRVFRPSTCRRWPQEGIPQGDDEGVAQTAQDAHFPQHLARQVRAAQHIRHAFQRNLCIVCRSEHNSRFIMQMGPFDLCDCSTLRIRSALLSTSGTRFTATCTLLC